MLFIETARLNLLPTAARQFVREVQDRYAENHDRQQTAAKRLQDMTTRLFMGRDADTTEDVYKPIMAYSEEAIDRAYEKELRAVLSIHGGSATRDAQIRQRYADRVAEKKAEIARQQAAVKLVEDEAGYTAAWDGVDTTAEALEALRVEIVNFVPDSLPAVVRKAAWCLEALADPDMNEMLRLLRSFASADPDQLRLGDATLT